jgi:site-specific DNA-cytosine methylase
MIVLSLFDGMSCGQIALQKCGFPVSKYYASEIDKHAIAQTQLNFPNTIQLGDVRSIDPIDLGHVDLLMGEALVRASLLLGPD